MNGSYSTMKEEMKRIYLDVCCLNRSFDDQSQDRIRIEAEAIQIIFEAVQEEKCEWVSSGVVDDEVGMTPDRSKKKRMQALCEYVTIHVVPTESMEERGRILQQRGLTPYDALHLACAEEEIVDVFLTTDDKLIKKARDEETGVKVRVENPVVWVQEVSELW